MNGDDNSSGDGHSGGDDRDATTPIPGANSAFRYHPDDQSGNYPAVVGTGSYERVTGGYPVVADDAEPPVPPPLTEPPSRITGTYAVARPGAKSASTSGREALPAFRSGDFSVVPEMAIGSRGTVTPGALPTVAAVSTPVASPRTELPAVAPPVPPAPTPRPLPPPSDATPPAPTPRPLPPPSDATPPAGAEAIAQAAADLIAAEFDRAEKTPPAGVEVVARAYAESDGEYNPFARFDAERAVAAETAQDDQHTKVVAMPEAFEKLVAATGAALDELEVDSEPPVVPSAARADEDRSD